MKRYFLIVVLALIIACNKRGDTPAACTFTTATITNEAPTCQGWGIVVREVVYPSRNIPDLFKQDGLTVCTQFELFQDPTMCPCCGGTYANILSMSN